TRSGWILRDMSRSKVSVTSRCSRPKTRARHSPPKRKSASPNSKAAKGELTMWLRLRQIALVAHKLAPIAQDMHDVFGLEVGFRDPGVKTFGLENALFPVGNQFIEVVSPIPENPAGGRSLDRR